MMAIRTTTTRTTSSVSVPSADSTVAPYPFCDLVKAYYDCRRSKRNSASALAFEADLERNLVQLHDDLLAGARNQPLNLYPVYRSLLNAQGVRDVPPSDLFFPDLSQRPPRRNG